jgi:four helix bundle protein
MATVRSFEELEIWKRARAFAQKIYEASSAGTFSKDYALKDQINESTGSIMDNIAEGFERDGNKEFVAFLSYSKASAGESRSQLYRAFDRKHISSEMFEELRNEAIALGKMIGSFMNYIRGSGYRGTKFSEPIELYNADLNNNDDRNSKLGTRNSEQLETRNNSKLGTRN